jgi:glutamyl-tRNA synthetase
MPESKIVSRFAPSPTGYLHVGGARTALFNWLLARSTGGQFLLRIEDTDLARSTESATRALLEDLRWLGLGWDNPQIPHQSRRVALYDQLVEQLIRDGKAYRAYDTPEELEAMRAEARKNKRDFVYRRRPGQRDSGDGPHVVRLAMPVKEYRFEDVVLGKEIVLPPQECQDFVIRKADGMPTYHFAVVVDDQEMGVNHVLRGQEHLKNTFYHLALQEALGYPRPVYAHLPIILNPDGSKMGKRDRDRKVREAATAWMKRTGTTADSLGETSGVGAKRVQAWIGDSGSQLDSAEQRAVMAVVGLREIDLPEVLVHDFRRNGYLPEVLLNFLALLGWNPGGDREKMSLEEMTRLFRLQDIGQANARFDREKLRSFQTSFVASAEPARLVRGLRDFAESNEGSPLRGRSDNELERLLEMCAGFRTFRDVEEKCAPLLLRDDQLIHNADAVEKVLRKSDGQGFSVLEGLLPRLEAVEVWNHDSIEAVIKGYAESGGLGLGKVAQPLRVAVTGNTISPGIGHSLAFLGKDSTLNRIRACLRLRAPS